MHNLPNILWLSIDPSNKSLRKIDSIVRAFDKGYPQKEGFIDWNSKQTYAKRVPLINYHIPDLSSPHPEGCYAISVFLQDQAIFILIKDHQLFKKVERKIFSMFEFKND